MPGGRPSNYRKNFHPQDYIIRSTIGECRTEIAAAWGCSRQTIYDWEEKNEEFADAIKRGEVLLQAWWINKGKINLEKDSRSFNVGVYVWMTKNILKWTDKIENKIDNSVEIKTNKDRGETIKKLFKDDKARELALQLAEHLSKEKEEKDYEQDSSESI